MILNFQHTYIPTYALGIPTCASKKPDIESESILLYMHSRDLEACDEAARDVFPLLNMQESVDQGSESMFRHLLAWPTRHAIRCGT
jgi:hypothetical protein